MKKFFVSALLLTSLMGSATQLPDSVAMTVGEKSVSLAEFLYMAKKDGSNTNLSEEKALKAFVELFENFKLKVADAEEHKLDKTKSFKKELDRYGIDLVGSYLSDKKAEEAVVAKEYERLSTLLEYDHILFFLPPQSVTKDTLAVYQLAMDAYKRIQQGEDIVKLGEELMQKDSKQAGFEHVRSLAPMKTIKDFEDHLYGMKEGELSLPFRTRLGFHIVRLNARVPNPGRVQVAHILIPFEKDSVKRTEEEVKQEADQLYDRLKNKNEDFAELAKQYSSDKASAQRGGVLPVFGPGEMVEPFEEQAFALQHEGDLSQPFKTQFGYHIVKLLKKLGYPSLDEVGTPWLHKMMQGEWCFTLQNSFNNYLKEAYHYILYPEAYAELQSLCDDYFPSTTDFFDRAKDMDKPIVRIDTVTFAQNEIAAYLFQTPLSAKTYSKEFMDETLNYFVKDVTFTMEKNNLAVKHPDIPLVLNEYRDGILLFAISNEKIWNKPTGEQKAAEEAWLKNLREKYPIEVNWKAIKKAIRKEGL